MDSKRVFASTIFVPQYGRVTYGKNMLFAQPVYHYYCNQPGK